MTRKYDEIKWLAQATAKYDIEKFLNLEEEEEIRAREKAKTKEETL